MLGDHFGRGVLWGDEACTPGLFGIGDNRPFPFDPVHQHGREESIPLVIEHLGSVRIQEKSLAAVREDVTAAVEGVAESRTRSPIHDVRRDHAELKARGHLQKHFELVNLWLVFWGREVKLDETTHGLLTGSLADAQVSDLATERANAACLDSHFVKPAVFGADLAEPVWRERVMDIAGIQK